MQLLDAFIQTPLTVRDGRPLALADEGRDYYRSISAAFSVLRSATRFVRDRSSLRQITISLIPLFGIGWFIPRLHAFLAENTDVDVTVLYAHHRNYRSDASDLSIRFGTGDWPGYRCERLLPGAMTPMCSASFLERHGPFRTPADLAHAPLVHDEDRSAWVNWLQGAGVRHVSHAVGTMFEDGQLTLSAARGSRRRAAARAARRARAGERRTRAAVRSRARRRARLLPVHPGGHGLAGRRRAARGVVEAHGGGVMPSALGIVVYIALPQPRSTA